MNCEKVKYFLKFATASFGLFTSVPGAGVPVFASASVSVFLLVILKNMINLRYFIVRKFLSNRICA